MTTAITIILMLSLLVIGEAIVIRWLWVRLREAEDLAAPVFPVGPEELLYEPDEAQLVLRAHDPEYRRLVAAGFEYTGRGR